MHDRVPWSQWLVRWQWRQGEHLFVAAPTGWGKTYLIRPLLDRRERVVVFVTKVKDDTITKQYRGWSVIREWPPPVWATKVLLWPRPGNTLRETVREQRRVFAGALNAIARAGGWCTVFDEQYWLCQPEYCGLGLENAMLQHHGRSHGLSVVNGTQRPAWVPLVTFSACSHAFIGKTTVRTDLQRLSDVGGHDMKAVSNTLKDLAEHEYLYIPARGGEPVVLKVGRG